MVGFNDETFASKGFGTYEETVGVERFGYGTFFYNKFETGSMSLQESYLAIDDNVKYLLSITLSDFANVESEKYQEWRDYLQNDFQWAAIGWSKEYGDTATKT